ncbi:MAG: DUF3592 domain-containing protein [Bacteroidota bacterium]
MSKSYIFTGSVVFIAFLLIGYGVNLESQQDEFFQKYDRTYGRILEYKKDSLERDFPVAIFIAEDSQRVKVPLYGQSVSKYEIGDPVELYYDLINPTDAGLAKDSSFQAWFFKLSGAALLVGVIVWLIIGFRKIQQRNYLLQNGRRIRAQVLSVDHDPQVKINGKPAYLIHCQWKPNDGKGNYYTFRSEPLAEDPMGKVRKDIFVYIDFKNPEKYWVDTSFLKA